MATYYPPTGAPAAPRPARRSRFWLGLAAVVLALAAGLALGRWVLPSDTDTAPAADRPTSGSGSESGGGSGSGSGDVAAAHGPATITDGVPSGYTHDKPGAASAASNAVQLLVAVAHGQADPDTVRRTWIASNANEATKEVLSAGPTSTGDDQTNKLPASTRVTDYSDTTATVEVWVVAVGSGNRGTSTAERWTTVTFQLTWERQDWKVTSMRSADGPLPGETSDSAVPPLTNGLYTFYIE